MPSSSRFQPPPSEPPGSIVQRGLLHYFEATCPSRHDIQVRVEAPDPDRPGTDDGGGDAGDCRLRILLPGLPVQQAHFRVRHARGNVCDIVGGLQGAPDQHFSVCLTPEAPEDRLAKVGEVLLTQIKRRIGTLVLRRLSASGASDAGLERLWGDEERSSR